VGCIIERCCSVSLAIRDYPSVQYLSNTDDFIVESFYITEIRDISLKNMFGPNGENDFTVTIHLTMLQYYGNVASVIISTFRLLRLNR
jgi:hypothetical protein